MARPEENEPVGAGTTPRRRILAGFGPIADEMQTIEAALALAGALRAEIAGHFVEESSLLDFAALPFAKTFRPTDRSAVPLELRQMEREISHAAATWRRTLGARAQRSRIACTFATSRGEYCTEIAKAAIETDIVVVNPANVAARSRHAVAAILGTIKNVPITVLLPDYAPVRSPGPVVLLAGDAVPDLEIFVLAGRMAALSGTHLIVLSSRKNHAPVDAALSKASQAIAADIEVRSVTEDSASEEIGSVAALQPSFVICPPGAQHRSEADVAALLRFSRAPLLLMRRMPGSGPS